MGPEMSQITEVKQSLHTSFTINDIASTKYYLGLEGAISDEGMIISQQKYVTDILDDAGVANSKPVLTHLPSSCKLSSSYDQPMDKLDLYRRVVGSLLYLGFTRLNITHTT